jgi:hypothetical protein
MKEILLIIIQVVSIYTFGQTKGVIIDSKTNEKLPYVNIWVENQNIGTTSHENGEFEIDSSKGDFIILSGLGYEIKKIDLGNVPAKIYLIPKVFELNEVIISPKKEKKEKIIGVFDNDDIRLYYASDSKPEIKARLFLFDSVYSVTPFLKVLNSEFIATFAMLNLI